MSVSAIHDLVLSGRVSAREGVLLLEMRRELAKARRPRWARTLSFVGRMLGVVG